MFVEKRRRANSLVVWRKLYLAILGSDDQGLLKVMSKLMSYE